MMRKFLIMLALCSPVILCGCVPDQIKYAINCEPIERQPSVESKSPSNNIFEDDLIRLETNLNEKSIEFKIQNKTGESLRISWNESAFVGLDNSAKRIIHEGVKYINSGQEMADTYIPKGTVLNDFALPADNVFYVSGQYGGWETMPLINLPVLTMVNGEKNNQEMFEKFESSVKGKVLKTVLAIYRGKEKFEYSIAYRVLKVFR